MKKISKDFGNMQTEYRLFFGGLAGRAKAIAISIACLLLHQNYETIEELDHTPLA